MAYFDYRTYLKSKIEAVCPDMREHKDGFNRDNTGTITSENGYHILPGVITSELVGSNCDNYEDTLPINIQLMFCGGRYVPEVIDEALCKAHCIRNEILKRDQFPIDEILMRTEVVSFGPEGQTSNDNTVLINMDINLILQYCTDSCV